MNIFKKAIKDFYDWRLYNATKLKRKIRHEMLADRVYLFDELWGLYEDGKLPFDVFRYCIINDCPLHAANGKIYGKRDNKK